MKNIFLIISICMFTCVAAQNWDMLNPDKQWNVLQYIYDPWTNGFRPEFTEIYKMGEDTLVSDTTYTKLMLSKDKAQEKWVLKGLVREEENEGFYYRNLYGKVGLVYKYNLELNDTCTIILQDVPFAHQEGFKDTLSVRAIDTVNVDGGYRKIYTLCRYRRTNCSDTPYKIIWIEGIGSTRGLLDAGGFPVGGTERLKCFYKNGELVYQDTMFQKQYPDCYYGFEVPVKNIQINSVKISPNPATTTLNIFAQEDLASVYSICNLSGSIIQKGQFNEGSIDVSALPKGVFILKLESKRGMGRYKFVKE